MTVIILYVSNAVAENIIPIDTTCLETSSENIIDFQGKKCLWGNALLKNVQYKDCIIEFDIWTNGERSYPGIIFRLQPDGTGEHMYLRPHASGRDLAVQYTPAFFGTSCWQLYHGDGYNVKYTIIPNAWIHFKVVVINNKAKLFLNNSETPVLECNLVNHINPGQISFNTTREHTYFTNLKVKEINSDEESALPVLYASENKEWEISEVQNGSSFQSAVHPPYVQLKKAGFEKVDSDIHGMLNISKYRKLYGNENCVYAKKLIYSEKKETVKMAFGYSDAIKLFLNEQLIYSGNYAYKSRGEWFSGNIGLYDTLYLNLEKGLNELFLIVKDNMGGCGIIFKPEKELFTVNVSENEIENLWSTQKTGLRPETTIYDPERQVIYYSNFDQQFSIHQTPTGYITRISMDGEMLEPRWIDSLYAPCGMYLHNDNLYVAERKTLSIVSLKEGKVIQRYSYPEDMVFANDVAVDNNGFAYITNSVREQGITDIFRLEGNKIQPWLSCDELLKLNAIFYDNGYLIVGNSDSKKLQRVNIETREIKTIACLGRGIIDGIKKNENGNYLISLWEGELYEIGKNGEVTHLFSSNYKYNIADFEYIPESGMLILPTFMEKNIKCFKIKK